MHMYCCVLISTFYLLMSPLYSEFLWHAFIHKFDKYVPCCFLNLQLSFSQIKFKGNRSLPSKLALVTSSNLSVPRAQ